MGICEYVWEEAWKMLEEEKEELQNYIDNIPALTESDLESPEIEESNSWNEEVEKKLKELEERQLECEEKNKEYEIGISFLFASIVDVKERMNECEKKNKEYEMRMCEMYVDLKERMNGLMNGLLNIC